MISGFDHYSLAADRALLDQLRDFYVAVVGLQNGPRPPFQSFGYWLYAGGRDVLHLSEAQPNDPRQENARSTFDHAAFSCTDLDAAVARLLVRSIEYRTAEVPLTGQRQLFFRDPAGNGVELTCPAPDSSD